MENVSLAWVLLMVGIQVVSRAVWEGLNYSVPRLVRSVKRIFQFIRRVKSPISVQIIIHVNFD
jgi:hypothetical protein